MPAVLSPYPSCRRLRWAMARAKPSGARPHMVLEKETLKIDVLTSG